MSTFNRKLHDVRIIKKENKYLVQGKYYHSPSWQYMPFPYWETYYECTSLKEAKKEKIKLLERHDMNIVG